jgi:iron complex outermembrane receptor protein
MKEICLDRRLPLVNTTTGTVSVEDTNELGVPSVVASTSTAKLSTPPAGDVGLGLCYGVLHKIQFIGAGTDNLMGLISPAALQQVASERDIAPAYYQVDVSIIRSLTFSQSSR